LATTFLIDLWYEESTVLCNISPQDGVDVRDTFYEVLRGALIHRDKVYKLTVFGACFALLDKMIELKIEGPIILKTLI